MLVSERTTNEVSLARAGKTAASQNTWWTPFAVYRINDSALESDKTSTKAGTLQHCRCQDENKNDDWHNEQKDEEQHW